MGEGYKSMEQAGTVRQSSWCALYKYTNGSADYMSLTLVGVPVSEPLPEQDGIYMKPKTYEGELRQCTKRVRIKLKKTYTDDAVPRRKQVRIDGRLRCRYTVLNNPAIDTTERSELLTKVVFPLK